MRTAKISVDGKEYLLCFSARVMRACTERYGGVEKIDDALSQENQGKVLDESIWLISTMMMAGAKYAQMNGIDSPPPLSFDDLYDSLSFDDLSGLQSKIAETVRNGHETTIQAKPPKNVGATPGEK